MEDTHLYHYVDPELEAIEAPEVGTKATHDGMYHSFQLVDVAAVRLM